MGHARAVNSCFPTGIPYPGIAEHLRRAPPAQLGMADDFDVDAVWKDIPLAVIDTETTGRDATRGDRIVEIAVVHFDQGKPTDRHALLVNPGIPIPAEAAAVHGITDDKVKGEPSFDKLVPAILKMLEGRVPVAYNAHFDRGFIFSEMRRAKCPPTKGRDLPPAMRLTTDWLDPLVWARSLHAGAKGFKLGEVAARLGIELVNAHRATDDAEAAGQVFCALLANETSLSYRDLVTRQRGYIAGGARPNWRR